MRPFGLSDHVLPVHPQLRDDELLSSWLVRVAWANRLKVHSLCVQMAGNDAPVWSRDIDRLLPAWFLYEIERLTGTPASTAKAAGLDGIAESLNGCKPNRIGNETWLLPLGIWHRKRRRFGVQYCPICLHVPEGQYIRRAWRLAFYTECEVHRVLLHDRCYACGAPVTYFRADVGLRRRPEAPSMGTCSNCEAPLFKAPLSRFEWPSSSLGVAVRNLLFMKDFGWVFLDGKSFTNPANLFRVLRQFIRIMASNTADGQLYDAVADQLWPEGYRVLGNRGAAFEDRGVEERHGLFGMATWLAMDWPERFRSTFRAAGIGRYCLIQDMAEPPDWYRAEYNRLLGGDMIAAGGNHAPGGYQFGGR